MRTRRASNRELDREAQASRQEKLPKDIRKEDV